MVVKDGIILKSKNIVVPNELQKQTLNQVCSNHMGVKKMKWLANKPWIDIIAIIEFHLKTIQCVLNLRCSLGRD